MSLTPIWNYKVLKRVCVEGYDTQRLTPIWNYKVLKRFHSSTSIYSSLTPIWNYKVLKPQIHGVSTPK